jgi:hypothetical protein
MVTTILLQLASHSRQDTSAILLSQSLPQDIGRVRIYGQVKVVAPSPHQKTAKENISIFVKRSGKEPKSQSSHYLIGRKRKPLKKLREK